jgi:hypothetical protein
VRRSDEGSQDLKPLDPEELVFVSFCGTCVSTLPMDLDGRRRTPLKSRDATDVST